MNSTALAAPSGARAARTDGGMAPRTKTRDPWLDNARLVAAVLIVVSHFGGLVGDRSGAVEYFYFATWPMRVPLYALIAGYFSSAAPLRGRGALALLRNVLFVYLFFDLVASVQTGLLGLGWTFDLGRPSFALWFLLALFFWRLALPVLSRIRFIIPLSIVAALLVGFMPSAGSAFAASRAIGFLPIFLVGWKIREYGLHRLLDRTWVRIASAGFLLGYAGLVALLAQSFTLRQGWMNMQKGYAEPQLESMLIRGGVITVGVLGAMAMLALTPRRRIAVVTYLGTGSLYIYLLHPPIHRQLRHSGLLDSLDSRAELMLYLSAAALLALLLASKPVRFALRWAVQPRYTWLFHPDDRAPRQTAGTAPASQAGHAALAAQAPAPVVGGPGELASTATVGATPPR